MATGFWSALAFRALMGAGWAGSYVPGLKALSDLAEGQQQSRAIAAHAAAVGVSGALSCALPRRERGSVESSRRSPSAERRCRR